MENILLDVLEIDVGEWKDDQEFQKYAAELSAYSLEKLRREPEQLRQEKQCVLKSTQELAFSNYKSFIQTAECTNSIFKEFSTVEICVERLLSKMPSFGDACKCFSEEAQDIRTKQKLNSLALSKHTQLLEILEIPQLMETCVRNGYYEEALELYAHVHKVGKKYGDIHILKAICKEVEESVEVMLSLLLQQLRGNVQLPVCLKVVGYLRRMEFFSEVELRLKFLQARDFWLQSVVAGIPNDDVYNHISKVIESCRVHLFDIITQYRAVFPDDDFISSASNTVGSSVDVLVFHGWVNEKVWGFLQILEEDLRRGVGSRIDSLLGQCMFFGLSFSRIGVDFRALMTPIFYSAIASLFQQTLRRAKHDFHDSIKSCGFLSVSKSSLTQPLHLYTNTTLTPPQTILDIPPLAIMTNTFVIALNQLRQCAPLALGPDVFLEVKRLFESIVHDVKEYFRLEHNSFTSDESDAFLHFTSVVLSDFLPFIVQCLEAIFPDVSVEHLAFASSHAVFHQLPQVFPQNRAKVQLEMHQDLLLIAETLKDIVPCSR
eukprot:Em0006g1002a